MKQEIDQLGYIQFDHLKWTNELNFITKEIGIYQDKTKRFLSKPKDHNILNSSITNDYQSTNKKLYLLIFFIFSSEDALYIETILYIA